MDSSRQREIEPQALRNLREYKVVYRMTTVKTIKLHGESPGTPSAAVYAVDQAVIEIDG
jgi:hypothetical protein